MREIAGDQVVIALALTSDWLTRWRITAYVKREVVRPSPPPPGETFLLEGGRVVESSKQI